MPKNFLRLRRAARIVLLPSAEKNHKISLSSKIFELQIFFEIVFSEQIRHKKISACGGLKSRLAFLKVSLGFRVELICTDSMFFSTSLFEHLPLGWQLVTLCFLQAGFPT